RVKIKNVVDGISALLLISEQNALIVYSPLLAGQIPASSAGHAFNSFSAPCTATRSSSSVPFGTNRMAASAHNSLGD
ncbi:hypothetical protein, partial [Mesorhizobium metallidurans]|uniref:hypothetical protein n=1 Tax=Mesorhizobium metallidurans TaxID=489722 RepID=UPI001AE0C2F8